MDEPGTIGERYIIANHIYWFPDVSPVLREARRVSCAAGVRDDSACGSPLGATRSVQDAAQRASLLALYYLLGETLLRVH